jgi:hypothetical protein
MKKIFSFLLILCLTFSIFSQSLASSDLELYIKNLNIEAQADLGAFKIRLSTQFGIPVPKIEEVMASVESPGDAYMCFRVSQVASKPIEIVLKEYQSHKKKGWGIIAKNLGIKPGSKEFHELKRKDFDEPNSKKAKGKEKGKWK